MWCKKGANSDDIDDVVELECPSGRRFLCETSLPVGHNKVSRVAQCSGSQVNARDKVEVIVSDDDEESSGRRFLCETSLPVGHNKVSRVAQCSGCQVNARDKVEVIVSDDDEELLNLKTIDQNLPETNLIIIRADTSKVERRSLLVQSKSIVQAATCTKTGQSKPKPSPPFHLKQQKSVIGLPARSRYPAVETQEHLLWKKSIMVLWKQIASHRFANQFLMPYMGRKSTSINPRSSTFIKKLDLLAIKKKIESGAIQNTFEFQRDIALMFGNLTQYNIQDKHAHLMVEEVRRETTSKIEVFLRSQLSLKCGGLSSAESTFPSCPVSPVECTFKRRLPDDSSETTELLTKRQKHFV